MGDVLGINRIVSDLELLMIRDQDIPYDKIKKLIHHIDNLEINKIEAERDLIDEYREDKLCINEDSVFITDAIADIERKVESVYSERNILTGLIALNVITTEEVDYIKACWKSIKHNNNNIFTKSEP